jgi:hypothetical protein
VLPLAGLGGEVAGIASAAFQRLVATARTLGTTAVRVFRLQWRCLSNPVCGVPVAITGIKLLHHLMPDPNFAVQDLLSFADRLEKFDLSQVLPPPRQNIVGDPGQEAYRMLPDEECAWGDVACQVRNGLRAAARGILAGFIALGNILHFIGWHFVNIVVGGVLKLIAWIIRYFVVPIVQTVLYGINGILSILKNALCVYIYHVSPWLSLYRFARDLLTGRKVWAALDIVVGIAVPMAVVREDCGALAEMPPFMPASPPPTPARVPLERSPVYGAPAYVIAFGDYITLSDASPARLASRTLAFSDRVAVSDGTVV